MTELILHHYDFSPFSEKIRLIFGFKSLPWRSVIIPSVMPKPDLVALTGGYRHTPVLQIGADIFCDTRLMARELERRYPNPPLIAEDVVGLIAAVEAWAERDLFWPIARYVSGTNAEQVGPELHADRAALRGKHPPSTGRLKAVAAASFCLMQAQLPQVESMVARTGDYLLSDAPTLADLAVYHALWFLSAMPVDCSDVLTSFPWTLAWMERIRAIGHGTPQAMSSLDALAVAGRANPVTPRCSESIAFDLPLGGRVAVRPEEYTTEEVTGDLVLLDRDEIAISRTSQSRGDIVVHFPRVGYVIRPVPG
jgi:glutathione S-transferase